MLTKHLSTFKSRKSSFLSERRKPFTKSSGFYPNAMIKIHKKTFYIKYEKELSFIDRILLSNFQQKYLYHAIDDILCFSKAKSLEQDNLLALLYSPVLSLQNNLAIDFFNIWIDEIYITKVPKVNKFLTSTNSNFEPFSYITLKLMYTYTIPKIERESFW